MQTTDAMNAPTRLDEVGHHPFEKGFHRSAKTPHLFVDGCVQIWPDTDFRELARLSPSAYCVTSFLPYDGPELAFDAMANWWRIATAYDDVVIALSSADIRAAQREGRAALVLATQGSDYLGSNLARLAAFHRLGLRMMIPAYNSASTLCDGLFEERNGGLTRLGRAWVAECGRLGVLIDLTHVGERASHEIMDLSDAPVVFSHSNPRHIVDNVRNITDDQIKACAATGGLVAPTNWGPLNYVQGSRSRPTLDDFIAAIRYVVDLVGIDHVGIGTDMSTGTYPDGDLIRGMPGKGLVGGEYAEHVEVAPRSRLRYVDGFDDYGDVPGVAERLHNQGFTDSDVAKILGENWLRVFDAAWTPREPGDA